MKMDQQTNDALILICRQRACSIFIKVWLGEEAGGRFAAWLDSHHKLVLVERFINDFARQAGEGEGKNDLQINK